MVFAALIFLLVGNKSQTPSAQWLVGEAGERIAPYAEVDAETPFRLDLELHSAAYVYLVSHDLIYGCSALFPSEYLNSDIPANPLPPGRHLFPGNAAKLELSWQSGDATSPFSCMLIVSAQEIPGMREALERFRQMGNAAFPGKNLLGGYAPKAGMDQVPPASDLLHDAIKAANRLVDPDNDGAMIPWKEHPGIFLKVLRLQNRGRMLQQGTDLHEQLSKDLSTKLEGILTPGKPGK